MLVLQERRAGNATISSFESRDPWAEVEIQTILHETSCYFFISPEMMDWTRSGELIAMVILGGPGTLFGPAVGAAIFILMETVLSEITVYWHLYLGLLLILVAKFASKGFGALVGRIRGAR